MTSFNTAHGRRNDDAAIGRVKSVLGLYTNDERRNNQLLHKTAEEENILSVGFASVVNADVLELLLSELRKLGVLRQCLDEFGDEASLPQHLFSHFYGDYAGAGVLILKVLFEACVEVGLDVLRKNLTAINLDGFTCFQQFVRFGLEIRCTRPESCVKIVVAFYPTEEEFASALSTISDSARHEIGFLDEEDVWQKCREFCIKEFPGIKLPVEQESGKRREREEE